MEGKPYPAFLFFNRDTNTLKFTPVYKKYEGNTYYFQIIVKEKHSDSVLYPYYCTVILEGKKVTPESLIDYKYKKAYEEALHFIQLTRPLKCDPLSSDRDFCSRVVKSVDACCMKFEYVGNKTQADGSRYFRE